MTTLARLPSVRGDFVLVVGHGELSQTWWDPLAGWDRIGAPGDFVQAAVRGAVQRGAAEDGTKFLALADLVAGRLEEGLGRRTRPEPPQRHWRGRFAQVVWNANERRVEAFSDHLATLSMFTLVRDGTLVIATDLRLLAASPWCERQLDLVSVYHYLNFAQIPAPGTIFKDIRRVEPGTCVRWQPGMAAPTTDRYYLPEYPEDLDGSDDRLAAELAGQIVATVETYQPQTTEGWGCFLSGGTDSSSIVSILSRRAGPKRVKAFSIGFEEQAYDEIGYARMAAEACGAEAHFARVTRPEAQALIDVVIESYDQPFGNPSAIPMLACTKLARERGVELLIAGDGGDEIFGGNERYPKDRLMEAWFSLPESIKNVGLAVGAAVGDSKLRFLNRVENFFERASLPNPDRFYTDDSFASDHYDRLLRPDVRAAVPRDASLELMRGVYGLGATGGPLHRIMRLDLLMAIAQNDVPKVHGAAVREGVDVRFPYLDVQLLEYTARLPERHKVRGLDKRYLFKRAMRAYLPEATLRKRKQGFALPVAAWLRIDRTFQATFRDTLLDPGAVGRGLWEPAVLERLLAEHEQGSWDHAYSLWRVFVLERWLRRHAQGACGAGQNRVQWR
jgi:asparagine synthase (glutamine-hydrolysing)